MRELDFVVAFHQSGQSRGKAFHTERHIVKILRCIAGGVPLGMGCNVSQPKGRATAILCLRLLSTSSALLELSLVDLVMIPCSDNVHLSNLFGWQKCAIRC